MKPVKIELLGTSFTVQTDEDPRHLTRVVRRFEEKVKEIRESVGTQDNLKIAILAGLLLSDETLKLTHRADQASAEAHANAEGRMNADDGEHEKRGPPTEGDPGQSTGWTKEAARITDDLIRRIDDALTGASSQDAHAGNHEEENQHHG